MMLESRRYDWHRQQRLVPVNDSRGFSEADVPASVGCLMFPESPLG